jgi:hypothetical protein
VPAPQWLAAQWPKRELADVHAGDALAGLANQTLSRGDTLIDFAPQLGCACAGAIGGADAEKARKAVTALEPPRAQSEIVDTSVRIEVSLAPAGEHHDADVAWGDFLAALPAALAMHPEHGSAPVARQSRTAPRRALQKKATLPRAYMAARAGTRRELESRAAQSSAIALSSDTFGLRREEISATRPNPWLARRTSQEGMTGPRGASSLRTGLAPADRWLLAGLMLGSSVLVAVLTSALTIRGMQRPASAAIPESAAHRQAATPVVMAPEPPARDSVAIARASLTNDSTSIAVAGHTDSARNREEASGAVAPPPPTTRLSPMPTEIARVPKRVVPRVERHAVALRVRTHTAPPAAIVSASSIATRTSAALTPATSAPSIAPPSIAATSPAAPSSVASSPAASTAAPAAATSPLANPAVLEELRAIHAEINARKRHMDSLTAALDSLNHAAKPD